MYYSKLSRIFTLSFLFILLLGSFVNAQCSFPVVGTNCVGACALTSQINYTVTQPCIAKVRKYCVVNEGSSLCADHNAFAFVLVDGVLVTSGNITTVGSSLEFKAECGSDIQVVATAYYIGGPVACVWLGNLKYSLREQ